MEEYYAERGIQPMSNDEVDQRLRFARLLHTGGMSGSVEDNADVLDQLMALLGGESGWQGRVPPPASKAFVAALPRVVVEEQTRAIDVNCTICVAEFTKGEPAVKLPCDHMFHEDCLKPWVNKTNSCPVCRHEMPTDNEAYEEHRRETARYAVREENIAELHDSMYS